MPGTFLLLLFLDNLLLQFLILKEMAASFSEACYGFSQGIFQHIALAAATKRAGVHLGVCINIEVTVSCSHTADFTLVISKEIHYWIIPEMRVRIYLMEKGAYDGNTITVEMYVFS